MMSILKWQWLRYRRWVLILAVLHLLLLLGMGQMGVGLANLPFYSTHGFRYFSLGAIWIGFGTVLLGFSFGVLQLYRMKRADQWAFLIQRPLSHQQIYLGLAGFTFISLALVILVPWLLFVSGTDMFSEAVVDKRHYLNGFRILLAAFSSYLVATLGMLFPKKIAFLAGILLFFTINFYTGYRYSLGLSTYAAIGICVIVTLWLLYLNFSSFRPNLNSALYNMKSNVLLLVPILISVYLILFFFVAMFSGFFESNLISKANLSYPRNTQNFMLDKRPIPYFEPHLETLPESQKNKWMSHLSEGRTSFGIIYPQRRLSRQPLMEKDIHLQSLSSEGGERIWRFSFDEMLFKGIQFRNKRHVGWLGPKGVRLKSSDFSKSERFSGFPKSGVNNSFEINGLIYNFTGQNEAMSQYRSIPENQYYIPCYFENRFTGTFSTEEYLYIVPPENYLEPFVGLTVEKKVKHPNKIDTYYAIILVENDGEYLIRYSSDHYFGTKQPGVALLHVNREGESEMIFEKAITEFRQPSFFRYSSFLISPALYSLYHLGMWQFLDYDQDAHRYIKLGEVKLPTELIWSLVLLHMLSAIGTWFLGRRPWSFPGNRISWTLAALCLSLPVPVCFLFFREKQPRSLVEAQAK